MKKNALFIIYLVIVILNTQAIAKSGFDNKHIHVGQWGPQTGPASAWGILVRGTEVYFKMINETGGIHGRKIIHHSFDDAYDPMKTKQGVKSLQEEYNIFAWVAGVGTPTGLAVKDYLMKNQIPLIGPASGAMSWVNPPEKYLFSVYPLFDLEAKVLCKYAIDKLKKKKIAIIFQNDEYGQQGLNGAASYLYKHKMKLVSGIPVAMSDTNIKAHVQKLIQSKPDAVLLWVNPYHAVRIITMSNAMKFKPQWLGSSTLSDFPYMTAISKGAWEGVITAQFGEFNQSNDQLKNKYMKAYQDYADKKDHPGVLFFAGFGFAEVFIEGLKRCGRDLSKKKFVSEMEKINNFKGVLGRISYKPFDIKDPESRQGQNEVFLSQCIKGGKYKKILDWTNIEFKYWREIK